MSPFESLIFILLWVSLGSYCWYLTMKYSCYKTINLIDIFFLCVFGFLGPISVGLIVIVEVGAWLFTNGLNFLTRPIFAIKK